MKRAKADKAQEFFSYWRDYSPIASISPVPEYGFTKHIGRRHRFDWAFPSQRVAVEIEGNAWHVQGGGKHMQDADLEKYNLASEYGWRVFRYSPSMLKKDPAACIKQVARALEKG